MPISNSYIGKEIIAGNDANQNATIPAGTVSGWIFAEGGPVYATINGVAAVDTAGIYVPQDGVRLFGPFNNVTSLGVFAATGVTARLMYEG